LADDKINHNRNGTFCGATSTHLQQLLQRKEALVVLVDCGQSPAELCQRRLPLHVSMFALLKLAFAHFVLAAGAQDVAALP
jgi:hypothetical protein